MGKPDRSEILRRLRLGDLRRLLNYRQRGPWLSDDDAGREDLRELLLLISLGPDPTKRMRNVIALSARWMPQDEAELLIADIERTDRKLRRRTGKDLGERMNLSNAERERLKLWRIVACDMTADERVKWRKQKERDRKRRKRRAQGRQPRAAYLAANSINREKPWITAGLSRATWYRHQRETSVAATRVFKAEDRPVSPDQAQRQQGRPSVTVLKSVPETERQNEARGRTRLAS